MRIIKTSAAARADLIAHAVYLSEKASDEIAERFLARAEESFELLSDHPSMGSPLTLKDPALAGIRKWMVKNFDKFLIFYMPQADDLLIVRVLHTSQDWWRLLGFSDE